MRNVLKNSAEVAHYWANKIQSYGRNSTNNIHFCSRGILHSYGKEIAAFRALPDGSECVFICNYTYSNTTTGHQSDAISASRHLTQFIYDASQHEGILGRDVKYPSLVKPLSIWEEYNNKSAEAYESAFVPKYSRTKESRLNDARRWASEANRIRDAFNLDVEKLEIVVSPEVEAAMALAAKEKTEQEKQAKKAQDIEIKEKRDRWLSGELYIGYPAAHDSDIKLRVNPLDPEEVETSRGATVPLAVCRRLYQSWEKQQMPENTSVGVYRLNKVHSDGITIGCHEISSKEIERFAKVLWGE